MAEEMFELGRLPPRPWGNGTVEPRLRRFACYPTCTWRVISQPPQGLSREARACFDNPALLAIECVVCGSRRFVCMHARCTFVAVFSDPVQPGVHDDERKPHTGAATQHARQHEGPQAVSTCKHGCGTRWRLRPDGTMTDQQLVHQRTAFCVNPDNPAVGGLPRAMPEHDRANLERNTRHIMRQFKRHLFLPGLFNAELLTLILASRRRHRPRPRLPNELWEFINAEFLSS